MTINFISSSILSHKYSGRFTHKQRANHRKANRSCGLNELPMEHRQSDGVGESPSERQLGLRHRNDSRDRRWNRSHNRAPQRPVASRLAKHFSYLVDLLKSSGYECLKNAAGNRIAKSMIGLPTYFGSVRESLTFLSQMREAIFTLLFIWQKIENINCKTTQ